MAIDEFWDGDRGSNFGRLQRYLHLDVADEEVTLTRLFVFERRLGLDGE